MDFVVSARGTCLVHVGILQSVARQSRGLLHMVCLSVPPKRGFFLCDCVFYTLKSTTTDIGFESTFAAAMVCFIHDDCVSFQWRGFSRGWLWVSLSFRHGDSANTGCTADIGLLIHPLRPNVCCNNAIIGVGAKLNLFAKYSAKFRRAIAAVLLDVASCVCLLVWPYIM